MKIAVASDHRGIACKSQIIEQLKSMGHQADDFGTNTTDSVDYPDYAGKVSKAISDGSYDRGILICGTGIGMCITANKFIGVRAAPVHDELTADLSRRHNDANVLCMSADLVGEDLMKRMIDVWVNTPFEGGRHARRLDKIHQIEKEEYHLDQ